MKIALCLSGGLRNFKDTHYSFEECLLQNNNVDVFFYGPENKEGIFQNEKDLNELFKPKKHVINNSAYYNTIERPSGVPDSFLGFYNILKCNDLKIQYELEHNFEYDVVIRSRTDYFWFRPLTDEEIEQSKSFVLLPEEWSFRSPNRFSLCDMFAIGSSNNMNIYSSLFNYMSEYIQEYGGYWSEGIMGLHFLKQNIPWKEIRRHTIYEYPCERIESYIHPYKFSKYFPVPDIAHFDEFTRVLSNKRREF